MQLKMMRKFLKTIASCFMKHECVCCSEEVPYGKVLCFNCNRAMGMIEQTSTCKKCGRYCLTESCYFCVQSPPLFAMAKAFCVYGVESAAIIKEFKYYNNTLCLKFIAEKITPLMQHFSGIDIITSVPMNFIKEYIKGYNHAGKLAKILSENSNAIFKPFLLKRRFSWRRQAILNRQERFQNISGVFICKEDVSGKNILLIDDAITTGATANECAKVLLGAGAGNVFVLTFAKSITDETILARGIA